MQFTPDHPRDLSIRVSSSPVTRAHHPSCQKSQTVSEIFIPVCVNEARLTDNRIRRCLLKISWPLTRHPCPVSSFCQLVSRISGPRCVIVFTGMACEYFFFLFPFRSIYFFFLKLRYLVFFDNQDSWRWVDIFYCCESRLLCSRLSIFGYCFW